MDLACFFIFELELLWSPMRGDGLKLRYSAETSTTFLQLFSLFSFTVDSQGFIAQDFFSISQDKRGKRIAKH